MMQALTIKPATPDRWSDVEQVFNGKGCSIARGCWCIYYRRSGKEGAAPPGIKQAEFNRRQLEALTKTDEPPGLIGYRKGEPVGWVSLGPREDFHKLKRSPVMKPVDDETVWSVICFVVPSEFRGQGIAYALLDGAIDYAKKRKVKILEAYPVDKEGYSRDDSLWFGTKSMYDKAGFKEVARRKPRRPVMRLYLSGV